MMAPIPVLAPRSVESVLRLDFTLPDMSSETFVQTHAQSQAAIAEFAEPRTNRRAIVKRDADHDHAGVRITVIAAVGTDESHFTPVHLGDPPLRKLAPGLIDDPNL